MADQDTFYKHLLDNLYDGVYFVDKDRRILYWNKGAERITGYKPEDVVGRYCYENILNHVNYAGICMCTGDCPLRRTILDGQFRETEAFLHHKSGHSVPVSIRTSPIYSELGLVTWAVEIFSDNSAHLKVIQEKSVLEEAVYKDMLTGLYNRHFMDLKLKSALIGYESSAEPFGVLFIDLDKFKAINDTYGHGFGDVVLKVISRKLVYHLRTTDIVGRWGGEEFVAIIQSVDQKTLIHLAEKLRKLIWKSQLDVNGVKVGVTISIGATLVKEHDTADRVIDRADQAQYLSKTNGRNRVTFLKEGKPYLE